MQIYQFRSYVGTERLPLAYGGGKRPAKLMAAVSRRAAPLCPAVPAKVDPEPTVQESATVS